MNRPDIISELKKQSTVLWDVIVIGGGATGLGIALDAATRGYKVLLLEQSDFAKGTSSRSTKLVHGGVRYLAQGDLLLVREALRERGLILRNAPHLTLNQEFIIPLYTLWDVVLYFFGLKFYDILAGNLSLGKSYFLSRKKTMTRLPLLVSEGLKGGMVYHDGQFDDARMALALAHSCINKGGTVINYIQVTGLLKNDSGQISGVKAMDKVSGDEFDLKSKLVVNATGVFADEITGMDIPGSKPSLRPSQGVHIVLDKSFMQSSSALMIPKTDDGRVLFAIPWYNEVVVGTTDTPIETVSLEPVALEAEIDFILDTAGKYLVRPPVRKDVLSIFAGLRPLAANPDKSTSTKEVSRRHRITLSPSGLLTIIGGKWTTYRIMAKEVIDKAIRAGFLPKRKCLTSGLKLTSVLVAGSTDRLRIYGEGIFEIEKMIDENPDLGIPISPEFAFTKAEIIWVCRNEMPVMLEDVLARRTRALFLNARASLEIASEVAALMASEMGCDVEWQKKQVESYVKIAGNYI